MITHDPESTYSFRAALYAIVALGIFVLLGLAENRAPALQIQDQRIDPIQLAAMQCREPGRREELVVRIQRGRDGFTVVGCVVNASAASNN